MAVKLDIKRVLKAVDQRNFDFYNSLSEEEKKAFSPYVLMRFTSNVEGNRDLQEWFIETTNEYVNKNYFLLASKHKELLWKLYASTGIGTSLYHPYLSTTGKENNKNNYSKIENLVAELNPSMKMSDVRLLVKLMTKEEISELLEGHGFDKKQRKEYE